MNGNQNSTTTAPPFIRAQVDGFLASLDRTFRADEAFWRARGHREPTICQFELSGDMPRQWFCELDAQGARIREGRHPHPLVVWTSTPAGFVSAMAGNRTLDVQIAGDLDALNRLLTSLREANERGVRS